MTIAHLTRAFGSGELKQVRIYTLLLTFSLLLRKIPLCRPKIIPIRWDISMWISFRVWMHFLSQKVHIMSIHLWTILMIYIQVLCHVADLTHGYVTSWENVLFTLENIGTCVKITWNYFPCLVLTQGKSFHRLCAVFPKTFFIQWSMGPLTCEFSQVLRKSWWSCRDYWIFFFKTFRKHGLYKWL